MSEGKRGEEMDELEISAEDKKILEIQKKVIPHDSVLVATTIGNEGTPSGRNMGPAPHRIPTETGQH